MAETRLAAKLPEQAVQQPDNAAGVVTNGYTDTTLNYNYARQWGSFPTNDGRYIYWRWNPESRRTQKVAVDDVPEQIFGFLAATDRNATNLTRKDRENGELYIPFEDGVELENGSYVTSSMDRAAYQKWMVKKSWEMAEPDPPYPDEILKQHFDGDHRADNQRWNMRKEVMHEIILNLTIKQRDTFNKFYGAHMTEEEIGMEDGVEKSAIENRLVREIQPAVRKVYEVLGIEVPTKEELKAEAETVRKRKEEEKARKKKEKEKRKEQGIPTEEEIRLEARRIHAVVTGKADEDEYIRTGNVELKPQEPEEDPFAEYDPDNPDEYVSDDYDPYDDPRYKEEEEEDLWDE